MKGTYLAHKIVDYTVECRALVAEPLFTCAESAEVFCGAGHNISTKGHLDAAEGLATGGDIKKDDGVGHGLLNSIGVSKRFTEGVSDR